MINYLLYEKKTLHQKTISDLNESFWEPADFSVSYPGMLYPAIRALEPRMKGLGTKPRNQD
jgi:hypothetical protein